MRKWPGLGERIAQRVRELGFRNLAQFADAKGYRITYIYKWAGGATPDRSNLERLAKDLDVHPAWLLFGDEITPLLRGVKTLAVGLALLLASLGVRVEAIPLRVGDQVPETQHYVNLLHLRRWWRALWAAVGRELAHQCRSGVQFLPGGLSLTPTNA